MPERPTPGTGDAPLLQRALEEAEQYRALAEGILALSLCRTEPEIFGVLMSRAEKLFPNTHWAVGKLSDTEDGKPEFELQAWTPSVHKQLGDVLKGLRLPIMATGFSHKLYFEHRIVVVEDCPSHPEQFDPVAAQRFGLRSLMGVPLVQSGHLVGVLYGLAFLHEAPLALSELQSSGLQNLGRVSALALDRQRTHAELERQLAAASRLNERMKVFQSTLAEVAGQPDLERALTNLLEVLAEATGYGKWAILTVSEDRASLHTLVQVGTEGYGFSVADPLPIGGPDAGVGGRAAAGDTLVVVEDLSQDPTTVAHHAKIAGLGARSAVSVPLKSRGGELLGVLSGFGDKPGRPPEEVLTQLRAVADLATLAMERFRLWETLQTELSQRKESEALYRTLVEESLSGVYLIQDGAFQYANPAFCRAFGYTESEMKGLPVGSLVAPADRETVLNNIRKRVSGQLHSIHYTFRAQRKDGREFLVEVHGSTVQQGGRPAVLGVLMDVTDQQRAARAQEASEARYRQLFDDSPEAILLIDPEKGYILVNRAATTLLGRPADQIIGCTPGTLSPPLQRDGEPSLERAKRVLEAAAGGEPQWFEWVNLRPDGSEVESEAHLIRMRDEGRTVFQLILRDVTAERQERKERETLERQLFQTQKLESLGVMAGGVAHDFNNLLTGILGHADLALGAGSDSLALRRHLDALRSSALRASELTKQLLAYSGKGAFELRRVDLSELVEDTARLLEVSVPRAVSLRLDPGHGLPPVQGDPSQLRQVLMNLVINAAESMGGTEGTVRITTALENLDAVALEPMQGATLTPGPHVILRVADTGCGMDEAMLGRIFEPFFTTKFTGRGLGLPALLGIVRGHGAGLRVKSEPENGSVFTVYFPAAAGEAEPVGDPATADTDEVSGTGLVLVVDDDAGVRGVARQTLELRGYRVIEAVDGSEALDHVRLRGSQIALVVLDATMPNMSGESTLREIRDLLPGLPVLLSSGYDEQATLQRFPELGRDLFLPKPYGPRDLLARVQALLAAR
ncbi:MAG TPA: PAS domain S-box protein [Holophagaceae bacterium]|jgi:two-component system cell cycle sensor histidine kinase/response regulator CckA|nr:PAS domain S-box protein [Holophagaceae bacterium]